MVMTIQVLALAFLAYGAWLALSSGERVRGAWDELERGWHRARIADAGHDEPLGIPH